MRLLGDFLMRHEACKDGYLFAKDLTLEQFFQTCERGDWILWLFCRTNPNSLRELTLAKGHCANTVRHLMTDKRNIKEVDTAIAFGEGAVTREELDAAAQDGMRAAIDARSMITYLVAAISAAVTNYTPDATAAYAAKAAYYAVLPISTVADANAVKTENEKLTANICRKYLPLRIWNQDWKFLSRSEYITK
jgi:hypothetical protein